MTMPRSHRGSSRRLYWSSRGEVACETHAPDPVGPRWFVEGWQVMPVRAQGSRRPRYRCQHCADAAVAHGSPSIN